MGSSRIYNTTVDLLRVTAILAVVLIHTTTRHLEIVNFNLATHQFTLFLNQAARFAVPLFFLISGYVLELNYRPGYLSFLQRRLSKIFVPYLFWSVIYYFFVYPDHHGSGFFSVLLSGSSSYQLYFIPSLLLLYLVFPLVRRLNHFLIISLLLIFQLFILNLDYHLQFFGLPYPISVSLFNLFPFVYGIYLASHPKLPSNVLISAICLPLILYFIFQEGLRGYLKTWNIHYFYSQWRPTILIYTVFISETIKLRLFRSVPYLSILSRLSFLVFFVHIIVLELIWKYLGQYIYPYPGFDIFYFSLVVSISFMIAWLFHRIPQFSRLTG